MAANMRRTRCRLSATAWGLANRFSSQAGNGEAMGARCWELSAIADNIGAADRDVCATSARAWKAGVLVGDPTSSDLIWFNGEVIALNDARIGVEDRGFQFADGVYEVCRFYNGRPFMLAQHMERLERS